MPATTPAQNYADYPNEDDVVEQITKAGITIPTAYETSYELYAAISEWEQATGYIPFLAGSSTAFYFDPPGPNTRTMTRGGGRRLLLTQPFATITEVRVGYSSTYAGDVLTENEDFYLRPAAHTAHKAPITEIEFVTVKSGAPLSIKVTGTPGYFTTISADAWNAIRLLAAAKVCFALKEKSAYSGLEWKQGEVEVKNSEALLSKLGDTWLAEAKRAARRYRFIHPV